MDDRHQPQRRRQADAKDHALQRRLSSLSRALRRSGGGSIPRACAGLANEAAKGLDPSALALGVRVAWRQSPLCGLRSPRGLGPMPPPDALRSPEATVPPASSGPLGPGKCRCRFGPAVNRQRRRTLPRATERSATRRSRQERTTLRRRPARLRCRAAIGSRSRPGCGCRQRERACEPECLAVVGASQSRTPRSWATARVLSGRAMAPISVSAIGIHGVIPVVVRDVPINQARSDDGGGLDRRFNRGGVGAFNPEPAKRCRQPETSGCDGRTSTAGVTTPRHPVRGFPS